MTMVRLEDRLLVEKDTLDIAADTAPAADLVALPEHTRALRAEMMPSMLFYHIWRTADLAMVDCTIDPWLVEE